MTTLAIIGSGIAGRSLIYTLAKEKKEFQKICLFGSDQFAFPCSLNSTAIVAPRGLTAGHSPLGDMLLEGYQTFVAHFDQDAPEGIEEIVQFTASTVKQDEFSKRYPASQKQKEFLKEEALMIKERGFLIDPRTYGDWLLSKIQSELNLEIYSDFVTEVSDKEDKIFLKTANGFNECFDKVIFAGGSYNRFWKSIASESKLRSSKSIQGAYLEFNKVDLAQPSFSLTFNGDNLIWNSNLKRILVGSTTKENHHHLAPLKDLKLIYTRLSQQVEFELPPVSSGEVKIGLREKAQRREPYLFNVHNKIFIGGFYKNGFSLGLKMARSLSHQYL